MEGLSLKSGRFVTEKWKVCHRKVEGLSPKGGRFVTEKWKVCHYGGRFVIHFFLKPLFCYLIIKNHMYSMLISLKYLFLRWKVCHAFFLAVDKSDFQLKNCKKKSDLVLDSL